jgi:hypothetical protein
MSRLEWWPHEADGTCPDAEQVAAFVDGGLPEAERAAVERHIARCARCYEVFSGTLAIVQEEDDAPTRGEDATPRAVPSSIRSVWLLLAAVIACLAVGGILYRSSRPATATAADVLHGLTVSTSSAVEPWSVSVVRGPESTDSAPVSAFEIGVLMADLHALDRAGDREAMRPRWMRLAALLKTAGFLDDAAAQARTEAGRTVGSSAPALDAILLQLAERFDPSELAAGAWTEAGRLSALGRQRAFFEARGNRTVLDRPTASIHAEELAELRAAWPTGEGEPEWVRLAKAFERIARARVP